TDEDVSTFRDLRQVRRWTGVSSESDRLSFAFDAQAKRAAVAHVVSCEPANGSPEQRKGLARCERMVFHGKGQLVDIQFRIERTQQLANSTGELRRPDEVQNRSTRFLFKSGEEKEGEAGKVIAMKMAHHGQLD